MAKFPLFRQLDAMDCGPACLQMISKYYGRYYSSKQLRAMAFVNREGVSLLGISEAAETIGFHTMAVHLSFQRFKKEAPLPAIVHWDQSHFIVVYKISKGKIYVADPALGLITYTQEEFCKGWVSFNRDNEIQGVILLLEPSPNFNDRGDEPTRDKWKSFSYLFSYLHQHRRTIAQLILGLLTGSLIQLTLPFLTQSIVDVGIQAQNVKFIYLVLAGQLMLFLSRTTVDVVQRWILLHLSTRINISIISAFLAKLFKLPLSFFEGKMIGDILRRVEDHARIERFLSTSSLNMVFSFFSLVLFGVVLMVYSMTIFLTFAAFSAAYIGYVLLFLKKRAELDNRKFQEMANNQSVLIQTVRE